MSSFPHETLHRRAALTDDDHPAQTSRRGRRKGENHGTHDAPKRRRSVPCPRCRQPSRIGQLERLIVFCMSTTRQKCCLRLFPMSCSYCLSTDLSEFLSLNSREVSSILARTGLERVGPVENIWTDTKGSHHRSGNGVAVAVGRKEGR